MNRVSLVSLDSYRTYQWAQCVLDYRDLLRDGIATPQELNAARIKWGLPSDEAQLALMEAYANEEDSSAAA